MDRTGQPHPRRQTYVKHDFEIANHMPFISQMDRMAKNVHLTAFKRKGLSRCVNYTEKYANIQVAALPRDVRILAA